MLKRRGIAKVMTCKEFEKLILFFNIAMFFQCENAEKAFFSAFCLLYEQAIFASVLFPEVSGKFSENMFVIRCVKHGKTYFPEYAVGIYFLECLIEQI